VKYLAIIADFNHLMMINDSGLFFGPPCTSLHIHCIHIEMQHFRDLTYIISFIISIGIIVSPFLLFSCSMSAMLFVNN